MATAQDRLTRVTGGAASGSFRPPRKRRDLAYRLDDFRLDVPDSKLLDVTIGRSIESAELELTIEGASTLRIVVEDGDKALLRSDTLSRWVWGDRPGQEDFWARRGRAIDAELDDVPFRMVHLGKAATKLTLTFEDRIASYLRQHRGARKVSRARVTRAEFVKMLVDEVKAGGGIRFHCPELHDPQPISSSSDRVSDDEREEDGRKGLSGRSKLKVKGRKATPEQLRNMERVLDVCDSQGAPPKATLAAVMACLVESEFRNLTWGDRDSIGILQVRVGIHGRALAADVERAVAHFLTTGFWGKGGAIALARQHPSMGAGWVAQQVQGSGVPDAYEHYRKEAEAIVAAYQGGGGREDGESYRRSYEFKREGEESSWDAIKRLADEVQWRRFVRKGRLWYVSEDYLFAQKAALEVAEGEGGVDWIDFDIDLEARDQIAEVRVQARADRWTALPGQVVIVRDSGPADGRWLVSSVRLNLLDASGRIEVTLRKPLPKLAEPAAETGQRDTGDGNGNGGDERAVDKVYSAAKRISDKGLPYVWGGGHGRAGSPSGGGYDCSGYTAACLVAGDLLPDSWKDGVPASGTFATEWGEPGKGKYLTVWANAQHVWIEFNLSGKSGKRADTSAHGDGGSGPRLRKTDRSTAGFTPRHWPGT